MIEQWTNGIPEKNLKIPHKHWPLGTRSDSLKYMYHDRKLIGTEYDKLGEASFISTYKPDDITMKDLIKIIRERNGFITDNTEKE